MKNTIASWPKWTADRLGRALKSIKPPAPLALGLISSLLLASAATAANTVIRTLPETFQPNEEITVNLSVTTDFGGWALTEIVPDGWTITDAGDGTVNGQQLLFFELPQANNKTITYKVRPETNTAGTFSGTISVSGTSYDIEGDDTTSPAGGEDPDPTDPDPTDPDPTDPDPTDPDPTDPDPSGNSVIRSLPDTYTAGQELEVNLLVTTDFGGWALTEIVPDGWTITEPGEGTVNGQQLLFFDLQQANNKSLTYKVRPSESATSSQTFSGTISVSGTSYDIGGDSNIAPSGEDPGEDPDPIPSVEPFTVTSADQGNLPKIYNLSGTYDYTIEGTGDDEGFDIALNYTLTHNQYGRLSGEGTATLTGDGETLLDHDVRVSGTVRRVGHPSEPIYRVNIIVRADLENEAEETAQLVLDQKLEISGDQLVGHAHARYTDADEDFEDQLDGIAIDLPEGRDGTWSLDFTPGTAESPTGAAVLNVPGTVLNYNLVHKGVNDGDLIVYTLEGADGDSEGNHIRLAIDGDGNVVRILGRALGQDLTVAPQ